MKSVFAILLVVFVLSACSPPAPAPILTPTPTFTPVPSPTATLTATLVPSPTPEPPGTIAGVDTTKIGFDVGELKLNDKGEIVYAATGEVAAVEVEGVMRFVWGPELIKHLHKVAKLGEMRNGNEYIDQATWDHMEAVGYKMSVPPSPHGQYSQIAYEHLIIKKPNGWVESYSLAWFKTDNYADIFNNDPHDGTLWVEPSDHVGDDLKGLIKIRVTNWISATIFD